MRRRRPVNADPELLELFGGDPEALAIVDAISATSRGRSRTRRQVLVLVLAAMTIGVVVAVATVGQSRASVIDRARAAFNRNEVVHLRLVERASAGTLISVRTGKTRQVHHVLDEWYARDRASRRIRDSFLGTAITDTAGPAEPSVRAAAQFPKAYEQALRTRTATQVGRLTVEGTSLIVLGFADRGVGSTRVAIDPESYKPVRVTFGASEAYDVVAFGSADERALEPIPPKPYRGSSSATSSSKLSTKAAIQQLNLPSRLGLTAAQSAFQLVFATSAPQTLAYEVRYAGPRGTLRATVSNRPLVSAGWRLAYADITPGSALSLRGSSVTLVRLRRVFVTVVSADRAATRQLLTYLGAHAFDLNLPASVTS